MTQRKERKTEPFVSNTEWTVKFVNIIVCNLSIWIEKSEFQRLMQSSNTKTLLFGHLVNLTEGKKYIIILTTSIKEV